MTSGFLKSLRSCRLVPVLAVLSAVAGMLGLNRARAAERPNVLMISIDDLNDWVGCLKGHPQARTPNIDRLARRGTSFLNAHCQSPLCNPSRTSLLTGLRPSTTGVYGLAPWFRTDPRFREVITLPQQFSRHGYKTIVTGKVFHDAYPPPAARQDGSEVDVWGHHGNFGVKPGKKFVETPEKHPAVDWGIFPEKDEQQDDYTVASYAVNQLEQLKSSAQPWFLAVGFRRPHVPCYASQKWFDLYPDDTLIMPPILENDRDDTPQFSWYLHWKLPEPRLSWLKESGQLRPLVRSYLASISFVDGQVGRVLDALEQSGEADRTIVVLWSDHGWHLGEKAISGKNSLWERSTRVPLIWAGPGITAAQTCSSPAELLDVYPTLCELSGIPARDGLEGVSLAAQLKQAAAPRERPAITTHNQGNHTIRSERYRYIRYADGAEEFYDLQADPNEWTNLATRPEVAQLKTEHAKWLPRVDVPPMAGSASRILTFENNVPVWEGRPIRWAELQP